MVIEEGESPSFDDEMLMLMDNDVGDDEENSGDEQDLYHDNEPEDKDHGDGIDELEYLDEEEREKVLADTAIVRQTVTKVRIHSV